MRCNKHGLFNSAYDTTTNPNNPAAAYITQRSPPDTSLDMSPVQHLQPPCSVAPPTVACMKSSLPRPTSIFGVACLPSKMLLNKCLKRRNGNFNRLRVCKTDIFFWPMLEHPEASPSIASHRHGSTLKYLFIPKTDPSTQSIIVDEFLRGRCLKYFLNTSIV